MQVSNMNQVLWKKQKFGRFRFAASAVPAVPFPLC